MYVDGTTVGEVGDVVVRDRRALAREGGLLVIVGVDRETGLIVSGLEIVTRGFVHEQRSGELLQETKGHLRETFGTAANGRDDVSYLSR